ncbi:hypothetical protein QZH41_020097, partial [Actinostola sp. cb2023]
HHHGDDESIITQNKAKYFSSNIDHSPLIPKGRKPIMIWWTSHIFPHSKDHQNHEIQCKRGSCITSIDRSLRDDPATRMFIFYGTDLRATELPLPRSPWHEWALFHEESPKNNWMLTFENALRMFNHTATFRRESDYPLSSQYVKDLRDWTQPPVPLEMKNRLQKEKGLAAVVYVQRDCHTPSDRESYLQELMKHLKIDSYGPCLNNKKMPQEIDGFVKLHSPVFHEFLAQYKFHIAFENAICQDYMTEKLFRPIEVGSVPIYMGSSLARDWMPNEKSVIFVDNFLSPEDLAKYIRYLDSDGDAYQKYLEYKKPGGITNEYLLKAIKNRPWHILGDWDKVNFGHRMYAHFECHLCDRMIEHQEALQAHKLNPGKFPPPPPKVAHGDHLECPEPVMSIDLEQKINKSTNYWEGYREAIAFKNMLEAREIDSSKFTSKYLKEKTDKYP